MTRWRTSGAITINGGEATVGTIYVGASTVNAGTLAFTDTTLELSGKTTESYVFAEVTGEGVFANAPALDKKGWKARLSRDGRRIVVDKNCVVILIR